MNHLFQNELFTLSFLGRLTGIKEDIEGIPFIVFLVKFTDHKLLAFNVPLR